MEWQFTLLDFVLFTWGLLASLACLDQHHKFVIARMMIHALLKDKQLSNELAEMYRKHMAKDEK